MDVRLFGRRLRAARISTGFERPEDFAAVLRMKTDTYLRLEDGTFEAKDLDLSLLEEISRLTDRTIDFFVTGKTAA